MWFISVEGQAKGPFSDEQLQQLVQARRIEPDQFVWREGWPEWKPAGAAIAELKRPPAPPAIPAAPVQVAASADSATAAHSHAATTPPGDGQRTGEHPSGWLDSKIGEAGSTAGSFLGTYGPLAAGLSVVADFIQPILSLTAPVTIGSLAAAFLLWAVARAAPARRQTLMTFCRFFLLLFVCSGAWWGLQSLLPGAKSSGAIVGMIPGAGNIQESLLGSMQRVEEQTKRVGDILEEQAKRDAERERQAKAEQEEGERELAEMERASKEGLKTRIQEAGLTVDSAGYVQAIMKSMPMISEFEQLGIKPTEADYAAALKSVEADGELYGILGPIYEITPRFPFLRTMGQTMRSDGKALRALFTGTGGKDKLCAAGAAKMPVAVGQLAEVCSKSGLQFAAAYSFWFSKIYPRLASDPSSRDYIDTISPTDYLRQDLSKLGATKVQGPLRLKTAEGCSYLEGDYSFYLADGLNPYGAFEQPGSPDITFFDVSDPDFGKLKLAGKCPFHEVMRRMKPQCRARVLVATPCDGVMQPNVIKVLQLLQ